MYRISIVVLDLFKLDTTLGLITNPTAPTSLLLVRMPVGTVLVEGCG
jgi:hypothetical protein